MAEVNRAAHKALVIRQLEQDNPGGHHASAVRIFADAFLEYAEAQANIDANGAVVFHPRTGAPISNPYIAIRDAAAAKMMKVKLRTDRVWAAAEQ